MPEQRNAYKGSPLRPWFTLAVVAADGSTKSIEVLADTGNPCALIVSPQLLDEFNSGLAPGTETNFGPLAGGWLRLQIPEVDFEEDVLCYASDAVVEAVQASHENLTGLAGLPLLKMMEYGGDNNHFWIRRIPSDH